MATITSIAQEQSTTLLLSYAFSGALGSVPNGVSCSLFSQTAEIFSFVAALDHPGHVHDKLIDRHLVVIDRHRSEVLSASPIEISREQLADAILSATGQHLSTSTRFSDGSLSISYKVSVEEDPNEFYILQPRHHGNVASTNSFMQLVSSTIDLTILPLPTVYPILGDVER